MKSAQAAMLEMLPKSARAGVLAGMSIPELLLLPYDALMALDTQEREGYTKRVAPVAWAAGNLRYLLDDTQRAMLAAMERSFSGQKTGRAPKVVKEDTRTMEEILAAGEFEEALDEIDLPVSFFLLCARGNGKSWMLVARAFEVALSRPESTTYYVCPLMDDAIKIVTDIVNKFLLKECPEELMPEWKAGDAEYHFKNGSIIRFRGTNNESVERMRGTGAHFIVLDECGGMDRLKYVLQVVGPVAERWDGVIVLATTPAKTTEHESKEVYESHAKRGSAVKFTMLDNVRDDWRRKARKLLRVDNPKEKREDILAIIEGKKLPSTTYALREYFCEFVTDSEAAVAPEYNADLERETTVKDLVPPPFRDLYVAMDPGKKDYTGILYAYVDFLRGKLVIEDESLLTNRDSNTDGIADEIRAKELTLWGAGTKVRTRVSDVELRLIEDLGAQGLVFETAEKKDSDAAIRLMRKMLTGQVEIHERCVELRKQLRGATWNNARTDFAHQPGGGHYDLVAALKYLCRTVDLRRNPYPAGWREERAQDVWRRTDVTAKKETHPATPLERKVSSVERVVGFAAKLMQGGRHVR